MIKKRGRPPKYNEEEVLTKALMTFWEKGLASTSLDDLSAAMGMNRPSIYNAFGDKEAIYRLAFSRFKARVEMGLNQALLESDLKCALDQLFSSALNTYYSGNKPLGCFCMITAPVESLNYEQIQQDLQGMINMVDEKIESRLKLAPQDAFSIDVDLTQVAKVLHSVLQGIAIRVRSGDSRESVESIYKNTLDLICR